MRFAAMSLHRFDDAEQALAEAEAIPGTSTNLRIALLQTRALLSQFRGDLETAARMCEQLRKEHRSLGNTRGEQSAARNLAEVEHARGQTQRAIAIVREMLPAVRSGADNDLARQPARQPRGLSRRGGRSFRRGRGGARVDRDPCRARAGPVPTSRLRSSTWRSSSRCAAILRARPHSKATPTPRLQRHGFEREFTETTTHDRLTALLRDGLAPDELARLTAEGAALSTRGGNRTRA